VIPRYTRPGMGKIWSEQNKFSIWLEIEILACEAQAHSGVIPADAVEVIRNKARFDVRRIEDIEEEVKHDVIAFLTNVAEYVGPESRFIHLGMTSSDVLDTALAVQMKQSGEMLLDGVRKLITVLADQAKTYKNTVMVGRTHGIHAEPITFGLKMALWYEEMKRNEDRLKRAIEAVSVGMVSGAVGTYEHLEPSVEEYVCQKLGLRPAPVSTQVIQRDRHAEFLSTLAVVAATLEKIATEIRHLQRTEVLEAEEFFSKGQKGSSAMPHKRNPITCERIAGLARILRGNAVAALENVALWHERDISHSSVERVIVPDSCILLDYMLAKTTDVVKNLLVYPDRMLENLNKTNGLVASQSVLLALAKKGMRREDAYRIVQRNAMETWQTGKPFRELLERDSEITAVLNKKDLDAMFDLNRSIRHIDTIFKRIGLA
jgi:adenylosuccinate lyase